MRRRDFCISGAAGAAISISNPAGAAETRRPNALLLLGHRAPGLASEGVTFTRCYATRPSHAFSLASLITGKYPHACGLKREGQAIAPDQPSILRQLQAAGYATAMGPQPFFLLDESGDEGLLEAIDDDAGLARDTLVVSTATRGAEDDSYSETSARMPLVIRFPGRLRRGVTDDLLLSGADLMPSLLALCGVEIPEGVQGRNLAETMRSGEGERPESVYSYGKLGEAGEWRMIVRGLDKLVVNAKLETTHLYNLGQDPSEERNLAAEIGAGRNRDELKAHLRAWMKKLGDGVDPSSGLKVR